MSSLTRLHMSTNETINKEIWNLERTSADRLAYLTDNWISRVASRVTPRFVGMREGPNTYPSYLDQNRRQIFTEHGGYRQSTSARRAHCVCHYASTICMQDEIQCGKQRMHIAGHAAFGLYFGICDSSPFCIHHKTDNCGAFQVRSCER